LFWLCNLVTRKCYVNVAKRVPPHGQRFDCSLHWAALVESIVPAKNPDSSVAEDLVAGLLERE